MMQSLKQLVTHSGFRVGLQLGTGQFIIALVVFIRNPFSGIAWVGSINHPAVSMLLSQVSAVFHELPHQYLQLSTSSFGVAEPPHRDSAAGSSQHGRRSCCGHHSGSRLHCHGWAAGLCLCYVAGHLHSLVLGAPSCGPRQVSLLSHPWQPLRLYI